MPYNKRSDLPDSVTDTLPSHAQDIYKEAYNSAWDQYASPDDRDGDDTREEVSHKVAWAAVKNVYKKNDDGNWVKK